MKTLKAPKLPKQSKTVANKIIADNPWCLGKELAELVSENYEDIKAIQAYSLPNFCSQVSNLNCVKVFGKRYTLSPYHIISTICENYL